MTKVNFLSPNRKVKVIFRTGHAKVRFGVDVTGDTGTGPYMISLHSPWLGRSLIVESIENCETFMEGDAQASLQKAQEYLSTQGNYRNDMIALPTVGMNDHAFLALPGKQAEFRVLLETSLPEITELAAGTTKTLQIEARILDLGGDDRQWNDDTSLSVVLDIAGPLKPYRKAFAIDVGTTNTCAAFMAGDPPRPHLFMYRGAKTGSIPTIVAYDSLRGDYRKYDIANQALRRAATESGRPVRSFKRYLGAPEQQRALPIVDGRGEQQQLRVDKVYYDFVSRYLEDFRDQHMVEVRLIKATYPPKFTPRAMMALKSTYKDVGVDPRDERLLGVDEASAAALWYVWRRLERVRFDVEQYRATYQDDHKMLVFDLGGGTTDIALVSTTASLVTRDGRRSRRLSFKVIESTSLSDLGGDNLTLAVFKALKCRIALKVAEVNKGTPPPAAMKSEESRNALRELHELRREYNAGLDAADGTPAQYEAFSAPIEELAGDVFPTAWKTIEDRIERDDESVGMFDVQGAMHNFNVLWELAEEMKKRLTSEETVTLDPKWVEGGGQQYEGIQALGIPAGEWSNIRLSRAADLNQRIRPVIQRAVRASRQVLTASSGEMHRLGSIQLVGNSCRIPLVRELIADEFRHDVPMIDDVIEYWTEDAKAAVALGACLAFHITGFAQMRGIEIEIENQDEQLGFDVGQWDESTGEFEVLFYADDRPRDGKEVLIDDSDAPELVLYMRNGPADTEPRLFGKFYLDEPQDPNPDLSPVPHGKLRLRLISRTSIGLIRDQSPFKWLVIGVHINPESDPFSGVH